MAREEAVVLAREPIDLLGHEALVEDAARVLDGAVGLVEQPTPGGGELPVAKERAGTRCRQIEVGRARPPAQQWLRPLDRRGDPGHHGIAVLRVVDRVGEHLVERPRPELLEQQEPAGERPRHARGLDAGAGHELVAARAESLDRRGRGRDALSAEDERPTGLGGPEDGGKITAGTVQVRLDDLQDEPGGARRVEGVPAALEHRHPRLAREPVCRSDRSEPAAQHGAGREAQVRAQSAPTWSRIVVSSSNECITCSWAIARAPATEPAASACRIARCSAWLRS